MTLLLLLLLAAVSVDGQLEFISHQRGHTVNINCTLPDIQSTDLFLVISMSISRITNNHEEVLALVTSVGPRPVSHSGVVTSSLSIDGSHESFVNIDWASINDTLEGDYVCRLNGLDTTNSPASLSQILTLNLQDPGPGVKATPEELEIGLTPSLSIKCYVFDLASVNVSEITAIDLSHVHAGIDQLIASISVFDGIDIKLGSGVNSVDGYLGNSQDQENFIEANWLNPGLNRTGTYECTFSGLGITGSPVHFKTTFDLKPVDPSKETLIKQLQELQRKFDIINQENKDLTVEVDKNAIRIRILEENVKGHKLCDSVDLPVGQYPITLFPDDGLGLLDVLCDVVAPGDVWTVFQKRYSGQENFTRSFYYYDNGFGSVHAEHWLGLKELKRLMTPGNYQIRVDLTDHNGINYTRIYPTFDLGAPDRYTLTVNGYNDGGHGLSFNSGADFSTYDQGPQPHCAIQDFGGWWYDNCAFTNLNGQWGQAGESGVSWFEFPDGRTEPLKATEMKFKKATPP